MTNITNLLFLSTLLLINYTVSKTIEYQLYDLDEVTNIDYYYFCSKDVDENVNDEWFLIQEEVKNGNCPDRYRADDFFECKKLRLETATEFKKCLILYKFIRHEKMDLKEMNFILK